MTSAAVDAFGHTNDVFFNLITFPRVVFNADLDSDRVEAKLAPNRRKTIFTTRKNIFFKVFLGRSRGLGQGAGWLVSWLASWPTGRLAGRPGPSWLERRLARPPSGQPAGTLAARRVEGEWGCKGHQLSYLVISISYGISLYVYVIC